MTIEIPQYGLKSYALFFAKHGIEEPFQQNELDWIVGQSMKKKIFSLLLRAGWIRKKKEGGYVCINPKKVISGLLDFRVPNIIKKAEKDYAFCNLSAVEIWSDFSYIQRGKDKSPYFIKVLKKDIKYWKNFFNKNHIPNYITNGSTIGEYIIFIPVTKLDFVEKDGFKVEGLNETFKVMKSNEIYNYPYNYIKNKYNLK